MDVSVTKRLIFATAALMGVVIALNAAHFVSATTAGDDAKVVAGREIPQLLALQDMRFGVLRIISSTTEHALLARITGDKPKEIDDEKRLSEKGDAIFVSAMRRYAELGLDAEDVGDTRFVTEVSSAYERLKKTADNLAAAADRGADSEEIVDIKEVFETQERAILGLIDAHLAEHSMRAEVDLQKVVLSITGAQRFTLASFLIYGIFVFNMIRKLAAARDSAEVANRAKSAFLSSMSHELRTPMNAVLGFAQILEGNPEAPLTTKQARCVRHIIEKGRNLITLIDNILLFSEIEDEAIIVTFEPVELGPMIRECLDVIRGDAEKRGIALIDGLADADRLEVRVDQALFKKALLVLLSNAVDYNRDGGDATVGAEVQPDGRVRITVADTGQGIARDKQHELFQSFHRLGIVHSDVSGSGIGLVIAKKLTELMGGRIGFESQVGRGSMFWIEFPAAG